MQEKLMILRKRAKLTQSQLADVLGISLTQYSRKERGVFEFTGDEMFVIKDLFGLPLDDIFLPRGHQNGDGEVI